MKNRLILSVIVSLYSTMYASMPPLSTSDHITYFELPLENTRFGSAPLRVLYDSCPEGMQVPWRNIFSENEVGATHFFIHLIKDEDGIKIGLGSSPEKGSDKKDFEGYPILNPLHTQQNTPHAPRPAHPYQQLAAQVRPPRNARPPVVRPHSYNNPNPSTFANQQPYVVSTPPTHYSQSPAHFVTHQPFMPQIAPPIYPVPFTIPPVMPTFYPTPPMPHFANVIPNVLPYNAPPIPHFVNAPFVNTTPNITPYGAPSAPFSSLPAQGTYYPPAPVPAHNDFAAQQQIQQQAALINQLTLNMSQLTQQVANVTQLLSLAQRGADHTQSPSHQPTAPETVNHSVPQQHSLVEQMPTPVPAAAFVQENKQEEIQKNSFSHSATLQEETKTETLPLLQEIEKATVAETHDTTSELSQAQLAEIEAARQAKKEAKKKREKERKEKELQATRQAAQALKDEQEKKTAQKAAEQMQKEKEATEKRKAQEEERASAEKQREAEKKQQLELKIEADKKAAKEEDLQRQKQEEKRKKAAQEAQKEKEQERQKEKAEEKKKKAEEKKQRELEEKNALLNQYKYHAENGEFNAIQYQEGLLNEEVHLHKMNAAINCVKKDSNKHTRNAKEYLKQVAAAKNSTRSDRVRACNALLIFKEDFTLINLCYEIGKEIEEPGIMVAAVNAIGCRIDEKTSSGFDDFSVKLAYIERVCEAENLQLRPLHFHNLYLKEIKKPGGIKDIYQLHTLKEMLENALKAHPSSTLLTETLKKLPSEPLVLAISAYNRYREERAPKQKIYFLNIARDFLAKGDQASDEIKKYKKLVEQEEKTIKTPDIGQQPEQKEGPNIGPDGKEALLNMRKILQERTTRKLPQNSWKQISFGFYKTLESNPTLSDNIMQDLDLCFESAKENQDTELQIKVLYLLCNTIVASPELQANLAIYPSIAEKFKTIESQVKEPFIVEYFHLKYLVYCIIMRDFEKIEKIIKDGLQAFPNDQILQKLREEIPNKYDITANTAYENYCELRKKEEYNTDAIHTAYTLLAKCNPTSFFFRFKKKRVHQAYIETRYVHLLYLETSTKGAIKDPFSDSEQEDFLKLLKSHYLEHNQSSIRITVISDEKMAELKANHVMSQEKEPYLKYFRNQQEIILRKNGLRHSEERERFISDALQCFPQDPVLLFLSLYVPNDSDKLAKDCYERYIKDKKGNPLLLAKAKELLKKGHRHSIFHKKLAELISSEPSSSITS